MGKFNAAEVRKGEETDLCCLHWEVVFFPKQGRKYGKTHLLNKINLRLILVDHCMIFVSWCNVQIRIRIPASNDTY